MVIEIRPPRRRAGTGSQPAGADLAAPRVRGGRLLAALAVAVAVMAGVAVRFLSTSELWLDEALSVSIAQLGVPELFEALSRDGHPPLYYVLLHGWMQLFGTSNIAVRALSGVLSCLALLVIFPVARKLGGRRVAWAAVLLMASSPFATRYATETRMYSLVVLLTLVGMLAVLRVLEAGRLRDLGTLAAVSGALVLTHYWSFFTVGATGAVLLALSLRGDNRRNAFRAALAVGAGLFAFLPWLPTFLFQLGNTGTPWSIPGQPSAVAAAIAAFAGDVDNFGVGLLLVFTVLTGLAVFGRRATSDHGVELDFRTRPKGRELAAVVFGALSLGIVVGLVLGSAYASRYAAVVLAPYLVLVSLGVALLQSPALRNGLLAAAVVFGLAGSVENVLEERTQAVEIAEVINERGSPGDVVVYCPDQLGPAHERLLDDGFRGMAFPLGNDGSRVDWVDYEDRNLQASVFGFAEEVVEAAGDSDIWLVSAEEYLTFGDKCAWLEDAFQRLRVFEQPMNRPDLQFYEPAQLARYPATFEPSRFRAVE